MFAMVTQKDGPPLSRAEKLLRVRLERSSNQNSTNGSTGSVNSSSSTTLLSYFLSSRQQQRSIKRQSSDVSLASTLYSYDEYQRDEEDESEHWEDLDALQVICICNINSHQKPALQKLSSDELDSDDEEDVYYDSDDNTHKKNSSGSFAKKKQVSFQTNHYSNKQQIMSVSQGNTNIGNSGLKRGLMDAADNWISQLVARADSAHSHPISIPSSVMERQPQKTIAGFAAVSQKEKSQKVICTTKKVSQDDVKQENKTPCWDLYASLFKRTILSEGKSKGCLTKLTTHDCHQQRNRLKNRYYLLLVVVGFLLSAVAEYFRCQQHLAGVTAVFLLAFSVGRITA